jgi:carboxyl-terminal processing protease
MIAVLARLRLTVLVVALGACAAAAPSRSPGAASTPAPSGPAAAVEAEGGLELVGEVFSIVERQYVVAPNFAAVLGGALRGLERMYEDEASFWVEPDGDAILVMYRTASEPLALARFTGTTREAVLRDVAAAYRIARQIDPGRDPLTLRHAILRGSVRSLDPHSAFLDCEGYRELQVETSGTFAGLGLEVTLREEELTVVTPIEGTPAWRAGIQAGDRILTIDGAPTKGLSLNDAVKRMRGPHGTTVRLSLRSEGAPEPRELAITRDIIRVQSVRVQEIAPGFGYVRIRQFQERTAADVEAAIDKLAKTGRLAGLVVDLRNNPGGLLSAAVEVSEKLLADGKLVVYTEGRTANQSMRFVAHGKKPLVKLPVVVLVNQGSASASEIVAGALQDHGRGPVVGTQSFGKGSVQTIIALSDGSGLRLTTAQYFTPKGRSIHGRGITPDLVVEVPSGDPAPRPIGPAAELEQQQKDVQLQSALQRLRALTGPSLTVGAERP